MDQSTPTPNVTTTATTPTPGFADALSRSATTSGPKQQFADVFTRENATTRRVLAAIPDDAADFRPHPRSKTTRELAGNFALDQGAIAAALTGDWKWPPNRPPAAATLAGAIDAFDATTQAVLRALANTPESRLFETVPFMIGPKQSAEMRVIDVMWFMVLDSIHHRGQMSIYLRMVGAKVPSIYGPSGDEPWM
ncbi:MAG TPA: DinB family protein [Gemmatimonadaceae bacterium]